jgi:PAS domain-containing protein
MRPSLITDAIDLTNTANSVRALGAPTFQPNEAPNEAVGSYTHIIDHLPFACFGFSKSGVVQFVNSAGAQLTGFERHELLGRQFVPFIADTDRAHFNDSKGVCHQSKTSL